MMANTWCLFCAVSRSKCRTGTNSFNFSQLGSCTDEETEAEFDKGKRKKANRLFGHFCSITQSLCLLSVAVIILCNKIPHFFMLAVCGAQERKEQGFSFFCWVEIEDLHCQGEAVNVH